MRIKFLAIASTVLLAIGFSLSAGAGTIADTDADSVPDVLDNCVNNANGPNEADANQKQVDTDSATDPSLAGDACDCDFTQDDIVLGDDIVSLFGAFNGSSQLHDLTGDGIVLGDDVVFCFGQFNGPPG